MDDLGLGITLSLKDLFSGKAKSIGREMQGMEQNAQGLAGSFNKLNAVMTTIAAAGVFTVAARELKSIITPAVEFQKQMAMINTLMSKSGQSSDQVGAGIRKLAQQFGTPALDQAAGVFQLLDDGISDTTDALLIMNSVNKLMVAGNVDMTTSVKAMTDAFNAWGFSAKDASHIANVFQLTNVKGATSVGEVARFMQTAAPVASNLGVSLEELAATIATLTGAGIKTKTAFTALNSTMIALADHHKELDPIFKKAGLGSLDNAIKTRGLINVLEGLIKTTKGGADGLDKFGVSGKNLQTILKVTGDNFGKFRENFKAMKNDSSTLDDQFAKATDTAAFKWQQLKASLEEVKLELGVRLLAALEPLLKKLVVWAKWLAKFIDTHPKFAKYLAIGLALFVALGAAIAAVVTVMGFLAVIGVKVLLVIAAIIAGVAGAVAQFFVWRDIIKRVFGSTEAAADAIKRAWAPVGKFIADAFLVFKTDVIPILNQVMTVGKIAFELGILTPLRAIIGVIKEVIGWIQFLIAELAKLPGVAELKQAAIKTFDISFGATPVGAAWNTLKWGKNAISGRADEIRRSDGVGTNAASTMARPMGGGAPKASPITNIINVPQQKVVAAPVMIDRTKIGEIVLEFMKLQTVRETQ